jgi:hypothetical protein
MATVTPDSHLVEVTRVVGTAEPTATSAPCIPLPEGMRLTVSMAEQARTVLLEVAGLLPEDKPIVLLNGRSPNHSSAIELTLANPVGPDGRYQDTFHLGENDIVNWSGQIIHQRGATCFEFTFPLNEPLVLEATAVPGTNTLLTLVQNALPANAFDGLAVLPLHVTDGERPLWAVYSQGFRNYDLDPVPGHFVAIYTWDYNSWQELTRQDLHEQQENNFGPDYLNEHSVNQVDIDPAYVWLAIDGGIGAHGGTFQLLRFDGTILHLEVAGSNANPGVGYLEDLNGDDTSEVILRLHDFYVFCYACGVRYLNFGVHSWDSAAAGQMVERTLQPLPQTVQDHPAYQPNNRAVELANADLWPAALVQMEEAERLAVETAVPTDAAILEWNAALIRLYNEAYQAELNHAPYPLLTHIFYGDYAAALAIMRGHSSEQLFSPKPPVTQGTVAEGNEQWLASYILQQTNAAIVAQPELAAAYYFRAWATYLNNPADPQIAQDLQQAAALAPDEPLFSQVTLPMANRIQFGSGETGATLTGQLQPQGMDVYTLAAQAGQQMSVMLTVPNDEARITVLDGHGNYLDGQMSTTFWQGTLPQTGDYVIRVFAGETAVAYTFIVTIE